MNTWAPLWSGIVDSSIWAENDCVVKIFLTMLALKDADHVVRMNAYQIGARARKDELEVLEALKVLSSPDKKRVGPQEFEGRRIKAVEDGWLILNGAKYREMVQDEMRKSRLRRAQAAWRERQKRKALKFSPPLPGEVAFVKALENGDQEAADRQAGQAADEDTARSNAALRQAMIDQGIGDVEGQ